jgi:hypothetical protein
VAIAYNSPGVIVRETVNPTLAPLLANPSVVALVGAAKGEQTASQRVILSDAETTLTSGYSVGGGTITVADTTEFASTGTLILADPDGSPTGIVAYTGKTATTFTGVTGGFAGLTFISGGTVSQPTALTLRYTGVALTSAAVKNAASGETVDKGAYTLVAGTDPDATVTGDEPALLTRQVAPVAAPTVAAGTGTLTGTYEYAYSFVNAAGETGISPASAPIVLTAQGTDITGIHIGPAGTSARKVYRRKTAGTGADNTWRLVATISNNAANNLDDDTMSDATAALAATPVQGIAAGDTVTVTYDYTDQDYYAPTLFDDYNDVADKYGAPFDADGNIDSQLSFAARLVFLNGASEIIAVAAPSDSDNDIETALEKLTNEEDVRIVVVLGQGSAANVAAASSHVSTMINDGLYRFAVVGRDGSTATVDAQDMRDAASALNNEAVRFVSPASFTMQNPITGRALNVGGQYIAAALAGMYAARDLHIPLTRKTLAGFTGVGDVRTASELGLDSAAGLLVIEDKGGILRVRHDITTAVGSVNSRESSVVRAKYEMAHRIKRSLDDSIVGLVVPDGRGPMLVENAVAAILESLRIEQVISAYQDVKGRLLTGDPTTVEVRFSYTPSYPLNNISVVFTIDTLSGDFNIS